MVTYLLSVLIGIVIIILTFISGMSFGYITTKKVVNDLVNEHGDEFVYKWKERYIKGEKNEKVIK